MSRPLFARLLVMLLLAALSLAGCAPPAGMSQTLTLLPGTFTPRPPTRSPSNTPDLSATPTRTQFSYSYPTESPTPKGSETPSFDATMTSLAAGTPSQTPRPPATESTSAYDATAAACPPFSTDTTLPVPDVPTSYIGKHYNNTTLPAGLTWVASGMLSSTSYSYTHVQWQGREMFWIQKLACQNQAGTPFWEISDALALPGLNAKANQVYTDLCFSGSTQVPFAIAYGSYDPTRPTAPIVANFTGWRMQVTAAWQMKDKFTALSLQGLTCVVQQP